MEAAYLASTKEALDHFHVTEESGLSSAQVHKYTEQYGLNCMIVKSIEVM